MYTPRFTAVIAVAALAGLCPAPIKDVQPGFQAQPEMTQEQRATQQTSAVGAPQREVGAVPSRVNENGLPITQDSGQSEGKNLVSQAVLPSDEKASQIVASARVKEPENSGTKWFLGGGVLLVSFGGVWALRFWKPGGFDPTT